MTERENQKKILIVDDEKEICDYLHEYFLDKGYQPFTATTSEAALELEKKHNPDIVLLDIRLTATPRKYDGIEILEQIRKNHPQVKVIMVTAVEDKEVIDRAMSLGASDYITKPISLDYLENTVMNKIQESLSPTPKARSSPPSHKP